MLERATSSGTGNNTWLELLAQVADIEDIQNIVLGNRNGVPVRIRDVAEVSEGTELRSGAATLNGEEVVLGTTFMLMGENSRSVAQRVSERMKEINRTLPTGVVASTALTLFVLPAIYRIFHRREGESEARETTDKTRTQPAPTL
jgi:Cu/Ag efflux pump CusA